MDFADLEKGFDILEIKASEKKSSDFNVRFSLYTAMAQFIIINKDNYTGTDLNDLTDEQLQEVIRISKAITELSGEESLILSVHRGTYISRAKKFHAHVCFGEEQKPSYLKVFDEVSVHPAMRVFWPSEEFVKNMWRKKPDDNSFDTMNSCHHRNVLNNPTWNYMWQDLPSIFEMQNSPDTSLGMEQFKGAQLVFHPQKPLIGLSWPVKLGPQNEENLDKFIRMMDEFAEAIGVSGLKAEDGCHLCVSTRGGGWRFDDSQTLVYGYLHVSGPKFYTICPFELRDSWLQKYKHWDGKVYT